MEQEVIGVELQLRQGPQAVQQPRPRETSRFEWSRSFSSLTWAPNNPSGRWVKLFPDKSNNFQVPQVCEEASGQESELVLVQKELLQVNQFLKQVLSRLFSSLPSETTVPELRLSNSAPGGR